MSEVKKGWAWPLAAKEAHYFVDGRSKCGKWMYLGPIQIGPASLDDCAACCRKAIRDGDINPAPIPELFKGEPVPKEETNETK